MPAPVTARSVRRDDGDRGQDILDATLSELRARGFSATSMLAIATAARTSKETLYRLFGDKQGLFEALVRQQAEALNADLVSALGAPDRAIEEVLARFGANLLELLLGERSIAINRAAVTEAARSPELGRILAAAGRDRTRPLVVEYLESQRALGRLDFPSGEEAFEVFVGLLLRDRQVRALLGVDAPLDVAQRGEIAGRGVTYFLRLFGTDCHR